MSSGHFKKDTLSDLPESIKPLVKELGLDDFRDHFYILEEGQPTPDAKNPHASEIARKLQHDLNVFLALSRKDGKTIIRWKWIPVAENKEEQKSSLNDGNAASTSGEFIFEGGEISG